MMPLLFLYVYRHVITSTEYNIFRVSHDSFPRPLYFPHQAIRQAGRLYCALLRSPKRSKYYMCARGREGGGMYDKNKCRSLIQWLTFQFHSHKKKYNQTRVRFMHQYIYDIIYNTHAKEIKRLIPANFIRLFKCICVYSEKL